MVQQIQCYEIPIEPEGTMFTPTVACISSTLNPLVSGAPEHVPAAMELADSGSASSDREPIADSADEKKRPITASELPDPRPALPDMLRSRVNLIRILSATSDLYVIASTPPLPPPIRAPAVR